MTSDSSTIARHPIQVAARRSGLSADVIRVWERRYEAVRPVRDGSRRLYSDRDVQRLVLLRKATAAGRRIGDVAALEDAALAQLVNDDDAQNAGGPRSGAAGTYLAGALAAVEQMDGGALQRALSAAGAALSRPVLYEEVIEPLMHEVGRRWRSGGLRICHEHLASAQVVAFLGAMLASTNLAERGPTLVVTTPAGQHHEIGALLAALTAASEGWQVVYLGTNTPASEIAATALQRSARAVALSIVYPPDDPMLVDEVQQLRNLLPTEISLIVGGASAPAYGDRLVEAGAVQAAGLDALRQRLEQLRTHP